MSAKGDTMTTKKDWIPPTVRQLSLGDLTERQREWVESEIAKRKRWTLAQVGALSFACALVGVAIALCVLFLSMVSGCALPADPVQVDRRFTPEEAAEIQKAADFWCDATNGAACVDLVFGAHVGRLSKATDGRRVLVRATEFEAARSPSPALRAGKNGVRWLNFDELGQRAEEVIVVVPSRINAGFFRTVVAHELGHHFDMVHVATPGALMFTHGDTPEGRAHVDAECLTAADVAELCNSHDCGSPRECAP